MLDESEIDVSILAVIDLLAAEIRKAVNRQTLNESCPQDAIDTVESFLNEYAPDAIARVPSEQRQALVDHLSKQMDTD